MAVGWALAAVVVGAGIRRPRGRRRRDLKRGLEMRRKGRDADALVEFQRAVRLEESGRAWAQVALAEQALGLWIDAPRNR